MLTWQWIWALPAGLALFALCMALAWLIAKRRQNAAPQLRVFSLDDDLDTEKASSLFRQWRAFNRLAAALLALAVLLTLTLVARPSQVDHGEERSATRDIVLCLDVSGSTLPYDREVIETYLKLVENFQGERIGMSIFNSTSRTVFPLTDDYDLVADQLQQASDILQGVQSQDDIDAMSDKDYQKISDWLDGTQNRTDATSLIGDGVVSCAAMIPGFVYGSSSSSGSASGEIGADAGRSASIVLATDNVLSGTATYTLDEALSMASDARISVDGLFSGPSESLNDETTSDMRTAIESHGGMFLTRSSGSSVDELVRQIDSRRANADEDVAQAAVVDAPGWWTLALAVAVCVWMLISWRLRR